MNWRAIVLLGLLAVATVHAKSEQGRRALKGYKSYHPADDCEVAPPCDEPPPCEDDHHVDECDDHDEDHWSSWQTEEWDAKWHSLWPTECEPECTPSPQPCPSPKPSPKNPPSPRPSPVSTVSPPPSPVSPCKNASDWKCANCYRESKGDMEIFQKCYDCYTQPSSTDDSCVQCVTTYVKDKSTCMQCLADVKAGAPFWAWNNCKTSSKSAPYMDACVGCILGTKKQRKNPLDFSGCDMCRDKAAGDADKLKQCSACWLDNGDNYRCSQCLVAKMGPASCYQCIKKDPNDYKCLQ